MITDKLENMKLYPQIPSDIADFVQKNFKSDIEAGRYDFGENYLNIEMYNTKSISDGKFESHKNYIDIQILLSGKEKIFCKNVDALLQPNPYNNEKDIMFYDDAIGDADFVTLDGTNFCLIYPHEAHAPQISHNSIMKVKKAVFKVKV